MSSLSRRDNDVARHERAIRSLSDRAGVSAATVRALYTQELARLEAEARVRSYLPLLAASNVRRLLGREHPECEQRARATGQPRSAASDLPINPANPQCADGRDGAHSDCR